MSSILCHISLSDLERTFHFDHFDEGEEKDRMMEEERVKKNKMNKENGSRGGEEKNNSSRLKVRRCRRGDRLNWSRNIKKWRRGNEHRRGEL
jgi:hypothetical protein